MADKTEARASNSGRKDAVRLVLALSGTGLIGYGAWLHYQPAGFVLAGALLFAMACGAMRNR